MDRERTRLLLIEDDENDRIALKSVIEQENYRYTHFLAESVSEAREILNKRKVDVIITNYLLGDGTGFDIFNLVSSVPIIIVTGSGNEGIAVKAMKAGAYDYLIKDSDQNYLKILPLTIENVIRRRKAEERLQLLESAVVNANDAIIILEAVPGEKQGRRILYVNDAFTKMTGYTFEEASSRTLRMLRGPRTSLAELDKIRVALENYQPVRVDLINYRKDGTEFWVECNIVPFADERGELTHWVSVQRDITDRKLAEEEREMLIKKIETINADLIELNQELETIGAERTMSLMALTVADRIRNPASMIGGRCRRILAKEETSERLRENLQYIIEGTEKLESIVKDFETHLKNRQSKFKHGDLNEIVESVVSVVQKEAVYRQIEMSVSISNESLRINMQKDLLRVAIFHIIKNAIEATERGGRVTVETCRDGDKVALIVSDTGYGIPEEDVDNIFKPFFSSKEKGFGMGLPLVKQIVSEHLGELMVKSGPERGATFRMSFPVRWNEDRLY